MTAQPFFSIMQVIHTQTHVRARSCVCVYVRACVRTEFYKDIKIWLLRAQMHVRFWVFDFWGFLFVCLFFFPFVCLFGFILFFSGGGILGVFVCLGFFPLFVCLGFFGGGGAILMTLNCLTYNRFKIFRKVVPFP